MSYLTLKNVTKRFRRVAAVSNLWLEVSQGEILSLLGPSGCGKSTTLQMIAGILQPDGGEVELAGQGLNGLPPERRDVALVLQRGLLFPHLTVGENVAFGLKMRGMNRAERETEAIAILRQMQLDGFADRKPAELSGGQAQRVALARSLVIRPKLLLLDEPFSALDANLREDMQDLVRRLNAQTGITMVLVTHDQVEAVMMSSRIALMQDGYLRQVAPPEQLYRQPVDEWTARFLGGVNFFPAQAQGSRWQLPGGQILVHASPHDHHGPIQVTLRPEQVQVMAEPLCQTNLLKATVITNRFTGVQRRLSLMTDADLSLQAWVPPTQDFAVGQTVWVHLPPEALWGFVGEGVQGDRPVVDCPIVVEANGHLSA
ncbi:MAG: ABC transporter ATP-binding protein [Synechococcales bacterium]|nr:ABC transporter ATP-binding protein [Synechococcales bacterium]